MLPRFSTASIASRLVSGALLLAVLTPVAASAQAPGGAEPFESGLGLEDDWVVTMIGAVGNYGEIYDRNLGPGTPFDLDRGLNNLWTEGGLLYAPPYR